MQLFVAMLWQLYVRIIVSGVEFDLSKYIIIRFTKYTQGLLFA